MEEAPIRRPIPGRNESLSFSPGACSESSAIMAHYLKNTSPQDLHDRVSRATSSGLMLPADLNRLIYLFFSAGIITAATPAAVRDETARHCARCHSTYLERNNGLKACVVMHDMPVLVIMNNQPARKPVHYYQCCDKAYDTGAPLSSTPHFIGRHTTLVTNVSYNKSNIRTCGERNCERPSAHGWVGAMVATEKKV